MMRRRVSTPIAVVSNLISLRGPVLFQRPGVRARPASRHVARWKSFVVPVFIAMGVVVTAPAGGAVAASSGFTPGSRALGDSLFPTIGNGGYDVRHYELDLDYAIARKRLDGTATIDAVATQGLSRFTLDLTSWNVVRRVTVNGRPARFAADAEHSKLAIVPPRGIRNGRRFRTVVRYGGIQRPFPGTTALKEGWIADPKTGAVVVDQPIGAMGWYPNNNVPADKATYTTRITLPRGWSALATGVLASRRDTGHAKNGKSTFVWEEAAPTSTYLVSVAVGKFDVNSLDPAKPKKTTPAAGSRNRPVPFYTAITSSLPAKGKAQSIADLGRSSEIVEFYSGYYGVRYPFTSLGGVVTLQSFGLNLETRGQTDVRHHQDRRRIRARGGHRRPRARAPVVRQPCDTCSVARRLAQRGHGRFLRLGVVVHRNLLPDPSARSVPRRLRQRQVSDLLARASRQPGAAEGPFRRRWHLPPRAGHD